MPHGGPRYLQIADLIERALGDGRLSPGDRLLPQRHLAALLQVDLTTVTRAYDEAKRRNLVEGRGALGTYVASPKVELASMLDLSMNIPPPPTGVDFDDLLKRGLAQVLLRTDANQLMTYHLGGGGEVDRIAGAVWLAPMFGPVDADRVVICPGAQAALAALLLSLSRPGDVIVTEPALYPGLRAAAQQLGRRVVSVQVDEAGMLPAALEAACHEHNARLVYLNPTLQNPTALTMPAQRRRELARLAARLGVAIIEDDPYWLLAGAAPAPIARHAPKHVYYVSTLSKCLNPGLRTAFVLLPDAQIRERFLIALRSFALMAAPLTTALVTQWIHDGSARTLLTGVQAEARARQTIAREILAARPGLPGDGLHVWLALPSYWTPNALSQAARTQGLAVTSSDVFTADGSLPPNAIRISLGSVRERRQLSSALATLSGLLARRAPMHRQVI
jgi:DNA-binding transcriptional MocR family regulator